MESFQRLRGEFLDLALEGEYPSSGRYGVTGDSRNNARRAFFLLHRRKLFCFHLAKCVALAKVRRYSKSKIFRMIGQLGRTQRESEHPMEFEIPLAPFFFLPFSLSARRHAVSFSISEESRRIWWNTVIPEAATGVWGLREWTLFSTLYEIFLLAREYLFPLLVTTESRFYCFPR